MLHCSEQNQSQAHIFWEIGMSVGQGNSRLNTYALLEYHSPPFPWLSFILWLVRHEET